MKTLVEEQKYPTAAAVVSALNVLIASGFTIQGFVSPKSFLGPEVVVTDAAVIFSMHAVARIVPLALVTLGVIYKRADSGRCRSAFRADADHSFRAMPISDSGGCRSLVPG